MISRYSVFHLLLNQSRPTITNLRFCSHQIKKSSFYNRRIPAQSILQQELLLKPPEDVPYSKILRVSVVGDPNAGKSTLVNQIVGWKTCAVSSKVHTTRKNTKSVLMDGSTQIVFLDTPGLIGLQEKKQHKLESSLLIDPEKSLIEADLVVVLHDVTNKWTRDKLSKKVLRLLYLYPEKESILVLNKVDALKDKRLLLELMSNLTENMVDGKMLQTKPVPSKMKFLKNKHHPVRLPETRATPEIHSEEEEFDFSKENLTEKQVEIVIQDKTGWHKFSRVFMISALKNDGLVEVKDYLLAAARPGRWLFHSSLVTDQDPYEIAIATVREKLLNTLPDEIPYNVNISVEFWEFAMSGVLKIVMRLDCPKSNISRIIVGGKGRRVAAIAKETEQDFRNIFRCDVRLILNVLPHFTHDI